MTLTKTMIVPVASSKGATAGVPFASVTSGFSSTSSVADLRSRQAYPKPVAPWKVAIDGGQRASSCFQRAARSVRLSRKHDQPAHSRIHLKFGTVSDCRRDVLVKSSQY